MKKYPYKKDCCGSTTGGYKTSARCLWLEYIIFLKKHKLLLIKLKK